MYIIRVFPLLKGGHIETLSYFSKISYPIGTVLSVPIRKKEVRAIVAKVEEVQKAKTVVRNSSFTLKKLTSQNDTYTLSTATLTTARILARHYATTTARVLYTMIPAIIRDGTHPFPFSPHKDQYTPLTEHTVRVLQTTYAERMRTYRTIVRESFARGGSVVIIAPTSIETLSLKKELATGIESRLVCIHSHLAKRELRDIEQKLQDFSTTKLIITYPGYALFDRHDITTVIIENESSPHFTARTHPSIDWRYATMLHARYSGREVILGSLMPRVETEYARRNEKYETLDETPKRLALPGTLRIIKNKARIDGTEAFQLLSPTVLRAIKKTIEEKGRVFLFAARRGLAPAVACQDCGFIFRSPNSGAPYSLLRKTDSNGEEIRFFIDAVSGTHIPAADSCTICGSWRLRERGIGIQSIYDELVKHIDTPVILFDHVTANTFKKACYLSDRFTKEHGTIMLGTTMALPYIGHDVTTSIVVNTDALRATPTWRVQETMLTQLLTLRERTTDVVYAQSHHTRLKNDTTEEPDDILDITRTGATERFYTEELEAREAFLYPPFARFILLTHITQNTNDTQYADLLKEKLAPWHPQQYISPTGGTNIVHQTLLRLRPEPDETERDLKRIIRTLPEDIRVTIDPERII